MLQVLTHQAVSYSLDVAMTVKYTADEARLTVKKSVKRAIPAGGVGGGAGTVKPTQELRSAIEVFSSTMESLICPALEPARMGHVVDPREQSSPTSHHSANRQPEFHSGGKCYRLHTNSFAVSASVMRNILGAVSRLKSAVKMYSAAVDRPREGVAHRLGATLKRVATTLPPPDILRTISGMDEDRVDELEMMRTSASTYAEALSLPRFAPMDTESEVTLDGLTTWHAKMLEVEDIIASARGLWRAESEEGEGDNGDEHTTGYPPAVESLRSFNPDTMETLRTLQHTHKTLDLVDRKNVESQLDTLTARARRSAKQNAVLATHKNGITSSFAPILGGIHGINLPMWHALRPGDVKFAIPDEMHAWSLSLSLSLSLCLSLSLSRSLSRSLYHDLSHDLSLSEMLT